MRRWQKVARRIRVPLGFVAAGVYLWQLYVHKPAVGPILWSLLLVLPGLWLRSYASGYVKKNSELTQTGPYAHTRNPLYLGSMMMAAGFAVALMSWPFALTLIFGFTFIYIPVIASEEAFLRSTFLEFDAYCERVPRILPRLAAAKSQNSDRDPFSELPIANNVEGAFSLPLYLKHREYNSAIGAALLYCSLFLGILLHSRF